MNLLPSALRGYQTTWLRGDIIAGVTLAAVAIPETMGYATIAQMPVVTGMYTVIFPTLAFALFGASKLLVVGADSATAALMAAGLAGLGIAGLVPGSATWVAWAGLVALVTGGLLIGARLLRLGFLGDFLSASVLIGFLTGVGVQVFSGQIPDMLGVTKGTGNWFHQQWVWITELPHAHGATIAFAVLTLVLIYGFKRVLPKVPGAVVAVVLSIIISSAWNAQAHGVSIVGAVQGGFPPIGLPSGLKASDAATILPLAVSCLVLIIAQSAATSRSFAMKHSEKVDVNRDIVGLSAASLAAGMSGTFVVNGSPTKTQILDEDGGRSQVANMTMSAIVLLVVLFFTSVIATRCSPRSCSPSVSASSTSKGCASSSGSDKASSPSPWPPPSSCARLVSSKASFSRSCCRFSTCCVVSTAPNASSSVCGGEVPPATRRQRQGRRVGRDSSCSAMTLTCSTPTQIACPTTRSRCCSVRPIPSNGWSWTAQ